ncbi:uncharacterized protein LOC116078928 [Mastomys coucha]|uniref:uncharacterized protein LOC116078928 n=1 Tax=Mastomys coucha TaxID=35658 RepID=UPI001261ABCA|nr:uncharacterized protein LOC116078928 [Mastomys coucha]XP_031210319.1 uncharacterized protein LOC116078928 [Mastomys coucha]
MRNHFYTSNGSAQFPQRQRVRLVSEDSNVYGLCLYMILCFGLGLGLGLGLSLGLNPGFGLSLGLGLGTGLSIRLGRRLNMPRMASLDSVHEESTDDVATEDGSEASIIEEMDEDIEQISDVRAIGKYEHDSWEDIHEISGDETENEGEEEDGQDSHQTKAT